jgi:hypothetical protein
MLARIVAVAGALALLGACSHAPEPPPGGPGGMGPGGISSSRFGPGSQQDLAATAGDRVFFDYDQADIKPEGQETLAKSGPKSRTPTIRPMPRTGAASRPSIEPGSGEAESAGELTHFRPAVGRGRPLFAQNRSY